MKCFEVYHGGTYVSLGFCIGQEGELVYISDVKVVPEDSMRLLKNIQPRIKTLVIDVLDLAIGVFSHMGLVEAMEVVKILAPEKVFFVGMSCSIGLHEEAEALLTERYPEIIAVTEAHFAYDGLLIDGFLL